MTFYLGTYLIMELLLLLKLSPSVDCMEWWNMLYVSEASHSEFCKGKQLPKDFHNSIRSTMHLVNTFHQHMVLEGSGWQNQTHALFRQSSHR